ncbi:MAG: polymer-forming cytoskeletal protein [Alphaproteobacteria bacterium]
MPLRLIGGRDRSEAEAAGGPAAETPARRPAAPAPAPEIAVPRPAATSPAARQSAITPECTVIGPHLTLRGNLRGSDDIVIRGVLIGDIRGRRVEVRSGARVEGDIVAAEAIVGGAVRGNVEAGTIEVKRGGGVEGRLENDGSCRIHGEVEGDINSRDIVVGVGAQVSSVVTADRASIAGALDGVIEAGDVRIEETARVNGEIECTGPVDIAGQVEGQIHGKRVIIREGATVGDSVFAEEITVAGTATGELMAVSVAIAATAYVDGQIVHHHIEIEQGAVVKGSRPWRPKQYLQNRDKGEPPPEA